MRSPWKTIEPVALSLIATLVALLALLGLPLAIMVVVFFHRWLFRSTRPGKQGLEDVFGRLLRLSCICGVPMSLFLVLGLLLGR
jgi:hypothetical protein